MVMEIGSCRGGTLFIFSRLSDPEATVVSLDMPNGSFGGNGTYAFQDQIMRLLPQRKQKLHLVRHDSHSSETKEAITRLLAGRQLDFLFIDGDHTYDGVRQDFEMYSPLVRTGGLVALHDIAEHPAESECQVSRFWNEIKNRYSHQEVIADPKQGWAGIGVLAL
jgi:predicted O-methyltransferase YrrM